MARADDEARLCFNVPRKEYNEMIELWPWGLREQIHIALLRLAIKATKRHGLGILGLLVNGDVEIRPTKTAIQNLNNGEEEPTNG